MAQLTAALPFSTPKGDFWVTDPDGPAAVLVQEAPKAKVDHGTDDPWSKIPLGSAGEGRHLPAGLVDRIVHPTRRFIGAAFTGAHMAFSSLYSLRDWISGYTARPAEKPVKRPSQFPEPNRTEVRIPDLDLPVMLYRAEHDIDHDGRLCAPGVLDASASAQDVLAQGLPFIRDRLSIQPATALPDVTDADRKITRVFSDGLNTPIEVAQWRVGDYVNMTGLPMAQLTNGATTDLGDLKLPFGLKRPAERRDWAQQLFFRTGFNPPIKSLEPLTIANQQLMKSMRDTLFKTINSEGATREYWVYSEATTVMGWVLQDLEKQYVARFLDRDAPREARIEQAKALREKFRQGTKRITFATTGTSWGAYPKGFRTVHFYAKGRHPATPTMLMGPAAAWRPGGETFKRGTTVFVRYAQGLPKFDAHNFHVHAPAVRATLEANGVGSVAALYDKTETGEIVGPDPVRIRALKIEHNALDNRWFPGEYSE